MQREEPLASACFLVAQFHESCGWSAAVRIGRQSTHSRQWAARNAAGNADLDACSPTTFLAGGWAAAVQQDCEKSGAPWDKGALKAEQFAQRPEIVVSCEPFDRATLVYGLPAG
jgi:hypothetical protein